MNILSKEYFQVFLYFILFNSSILSITVVLHEFGHLYIGYLGGCTGKVVLIDTVKNMTYTELQCQNIINGTLLSLGAFLFIIPLSILFLLLRMPERNFFYVILGLGVSTSSLDILSIFNSSILFYALITFGTFLVIYGESILINERLFAEEKYQKL